MLTDGCAAVQVSQVVEFISQFNQLGLAAAVRRVLHLLPLPLLLGQALIICHLLNDASHDWPKLGFQFRGGGVRVLHGVMKQSGLQGEKKKKKSTHALLVQDTINLTVTDDDVLAKPGRLRLLLHG